MSQNLFGLSPKKDGVYAYDSSTWTKIGGPGSELASAGGKLYGISPKNEPQTPQHGIWEYSNRGDQWNKIGGPSEQLIGGDYLCSIEPETKDIYMYKEGHWAKIGGPGFQFVWSGGKLYGISPKNEAQTPHHGIWEYTVSSGQWSKIGGPSEQLIGGDYLCTIEPITKDIYMYKDGHWAKIGGPGFQFVWAGGKLRGISPKNEVQTPQHGIWEYSNGSNQWNKIGGASEQLIGGTALYSIEETTKDIYKYEETQWIKIGGPGAQFVSLN